MKGLETSEVYFKEVLKNKDLRLEAEYHNSSAFNIPFYLGAEILENAQYNSTYGLNNDGLGYPILRMNEFDSLFIATPKMHFNNLSIDKFEELRLRKGDILMCRTNGNPKLIGKTALVPKDYPFLYESHLFKVRVNPELTNASAVTLFLNTKFGRIEIERLSMVGNQANFSIAKFKELRIPKFGRSINTLLEKFVFSSFKKLDKSKQLYENAEKLLLEEIGLQNPALPAGRFEPSKEPVNIKSFKDSFGTSGRLDAEYYQKKYEDIVNTVKNKPFDVLSNLVEISKSIEPGSKNYVENSLPFMRVADLSKNGLSEPQKYISSHFVKENTSKIAELKPKKGTILFSKDGSVGIAYHLRQDYNGITSGAILHLNVKDKNRVIPEYLTLALNSKVVQMQAERDAGGSIILHWRSSEIENVVVPIIDFKKQEQIAELIEQSFTLKKESEHLLEVAKRAVEIAIEDDEKVALEFIKKETA